MESSDETSPTPEEQKRALDEASDAARSGDPRRMLKALYRSYALEGLTRRLRSRWLPLDADDIDTVVTTAVHTVYLDVKAGKNVLNIVGLIWKVADRRANDLNAAKLREGTIDPDAFAEARAEAAYRKYRQGKYSGEDTDPELEFEEKRAHALAVARSMLPRLGQKNVQDVMKFIFEAVEADRIDVSNSEIADALGLSLDTVRTSKSRGFRRLERIARDEGLLDADALGVENDENDD